MTLLHSTTCGPELLELLADINHVVNNFKYRTCIYPEVLYIGPRQWEVFKEIYCAQPELYYNMEVVFVKAHQSYLRVGLK